MSEQSFLVLTVLVSSPRHGYAIIREVGELNPQAPTLPVATLYTLLDRLAADGLVEVDREEIHRGRMRRYYRVTQDGIDALAAEADRVAANVRAARTALRAVKLRPSPAGGVG
jgi:DNA-binding PadR family transcriptional regulator